VTKLGNKVYKLILLHFHNFLCLLFFYNPVCPISVILRQIYVTHGYFKHIKHVL